MKKQRIRHVTITSFPISLGQFLKLAGIVDCGAAAKTLLLAGQVLVNGEITCQRGKKLQAGDIVTAGEVFRLEAKENEKQHF
jgi:ribosome-associated protein